MVQHGVAPTGGRIREVEGKTSGWEARRVAYPAEQYSGSSGMEASATMTIRVVHAGLAEVLITLTTAVHRGAHGGRRVALVASMPWEIYLQAFGGLAAEPAQRRASQILRRTVLDP